MGRSLIVAAVILTGGWVAGSALQAGPVHACGQSEVRGDAHAMPGQAIRVLDDGTAVFAPVSRADYVCGADGRWQSTGRPYNG